MKTTKITSKQLSIVSSGYNDLCVKWLESALSDPTKATKITEQQLCGIMALALGLIGIEVSDEDV